MTRAPTLAAIHAAEMRVAEARQEAADSLRRGLAALRAMLTRPSTVVMAAGVAGLLTFVTVRRLRRPQAPSRSPGVTATTSAAGLVATFIVRYAMQQLPLVIQRVVAARQKRAEGKYPEAGNPAAPGDSTATRVLH